jgi:putative endonuclease
MHFDGMSKYTSGKRPLRLVYFEVFKSRTAAIKRENEIKNKKSRKYFEWLIREWKIGWVTD